MHTCRRDEALSKKSLFLSSVSVFCMIILVTIVAQFLSKIFLLKQAPYLNIFSCSVQFWPNFHYLYFTPAERRTVGRCVSRHSVEISISDGQEDRVLRVIRKWSEESCGWQWPASCYSPRHISTASSGKTYIHTYSQTVKSRVAHVDPKGSAFLSVTGSGSVFGIRNRSRIQMHSNLIWNKGLFINIF